MPMNWNDDRYLNGLVSPARPQFDEFDKVLADLVGRELR